MEKPIIVCVDDEKSVLNGLRDELKFELGSQYSIEIADSAEEGLTLINEIRSNQIDIPVIISDQLMPGMKGDEFLAEVYKIDQNIRKILLTGQATADAVGNAVNKARLYRYIAKPWDLKDLTMTVQEAAKSYFIAQQLDARVRLLSDLNASLQALSDEVRLEQLIERLLELSFAHTEAAYGGLVLYENNQIAQVFKMKTDESRLIITQADAGEYAETLPHELIEKIKISPDPLFSGRAFREEPFRTLEYVKDRKIRSFFGSPIRKQDELLAVIYLENAEKANEFTPMRIDYLQALAKQAAISIDKALLYRDLDRRVIERTQEIAEQKRIIEQKNEDITDSITYARRIQYSLLPEQSLLKKRFPDSFIYYQPKDIVSGDFYWMAEVDNYFFVAAVDCTGHGVPGAFMSVLGSAQLKEIVLQNHLLEPAEILNELNRRVVTSLNQTEVNEQVADGMDIALARICRSTKTITYASANRHSIFFRNHQPEVLQPDKMPIGFVEGAGVESRTFTTQTLNYEPGDTLYLFTDGVTDQFGAVERKKLGKRAFFEIVSTLEIQEMEEQKSNICRLVSDWRGELPQTDDILVIGVRLV